MARIAAGGGGATVCQGRNKLVCIRAKECLGALTIRRVLCRCGPDTHFMQRPCRCHAATHTCNGGYVHSGGGLSQVGILAQNPQQEVVGASQRHPREAARLRHVAGQGMAACNSSAGSSWWLFVSFFAEKPAGQRSSPSRRTSPSTVLQEVSLAEIVSCRR